MNSKVLISRLRKRLEKSNGNFRRKECETCFVIFKYSISVAFLDIKNIYLEILYIRDILDIINRYYIFKYIISVYNI